MEIFADNAREISRDKNSFLPLFILVTGGGEGRKKKNYCGGGFGTTIY